MVEAGTAVLSTRIGAETLETFRRYVQANGKTASQSLREGIELLAGDVPAALGDVPAAAAVAAGSLSICGITRPWWVWLLVFVALGLVAWWVQTTYFPTDEQRIRKMGLGK
ncbi:unnamed protein product [marine sediment metagenome]|uniref:Uncharacterized protein n=1 Tax=marine sediment metagenome TaxID=412755 RepID=X1S0N2_9ZZZZ